MPSFVMAGRTVILVAVGLSVGIALLVILYFALSAPLSTDTNVMASPNNNNWISMVVIPKTNVAETNYEPEVIKVVIGINNTVRWMNQDVTSHSVRADDEGDPDFHSATQDNFLAPGETFEYTFTKPGAFGYHGVPHPWMRGTVVVLEPGSSDEVYKKIVEDMLKQEIENTPLIVNVVRDPSTGIVQVHAVQRFILENSSDINAYLVYPTWQDNKNPVSESLTDRNGNSISDDPIFHDALLRTFDAVCPYTEIKIADDRSIDGSSTNKETTVYYGSQISTRLDSDITVAYYNYSLGTVEPDENGIYRLTFVTPYEAKVKISDDINVLSYGRSNCSVIDSDLSIPYFDIIFRVN